MDKDWSVTVRSEDGGETFGPYTGTRAAYTALARIAAEAAELDDGITRQFSVQEWRSEPLFPSDYEVDPDAALSLLRL